MKLLSLFVILLFFPAGSSPAAAPAEDDTLEPVVVTATRLETPLKDATTSITVITADDIRAQQAETVLEALRNVPGLDVVQAGSRGNTTSVFIRGSESDQVLVLVDGVEVNSTTLGSFDFAHLTAENIERIEVLRGAGGTLYGSQAIGGVINVILKRGEGPPELGFSTEGGNGHTHRQALSVRGSAGKLGYSLTTARIESQGFHRFNDDYRNLTTSGRLDYRLTEDSSLKAIFRFVKTDLGLFNSNNFIPLPDPNAREALSQTLGKLEWKQRVLTGWDYRISGSIFKEHDKFSDDPEPGSFDTTDRSRFRSEIGAAEFQTNYRFGEWSTTTFGFEFKRRKARTSSTSNGADLGAINRAIRNLGYYLQEQIRLFDDRLSLIPGIRLDDHQTFGTEWSPGFSAAYLLRETGTRLKAGYAEGFKAPTLNELFFPAGFGCPAFGNPDLGPEKSWELNAGFEQSLFTGRVEFGLTYFHREIEDLIEARPIPGAPAFCSRAQNVGRARFDGMEWALVIKLLSTVSLGANYTYLDWDTEDGSLVRRPRHRGNVSLNFTHEGFHIDLNANIVGDREDRQATNFTRIFKQSSYVKFDLASSYALPVTIPFVKGLTLFGKIENLFDRRYEEADGFRARPLNFLAGIRGVLSNEP